MTCPTCELPTDRWPYCKPEKCMLPTGPDSVVLGFAQVHPNERAVVYVHPVTGEVRYPGANNLPMPEAYRQQGYQRQEMPSLRSLERFEKEHNVRSEKAWFDEGSGRGHEQY